MSEPAEDRDDWREEDDVSGGVRDKHYQAYRAGHTVRMTKEDGTVHQQPCTLEDGAVMLDQDVQARFPDFDAVNKALRSIAAQD